MFKNLFLLFLTFALLCNGIESTQKYSSRRKDSTIKQIQNLVSQKFYDVGQLTTYESHPCSVGTTFNLFYDSGFKIALELNERSNDLRILQYKYDFKDPKKIKQVQALCPKPQQRVEQVSKTTNQIVGSSSKISSISNSAVRRFRISDELKLRKDEQSLCQELSNVQGFPLNSILKGIRFSDNGYWVLNFLNEDEPSFDYQYRAKFDRNGKLELIGQQRIDIKKQKSLQKQQATKNTVIVAKKEQAVIAAFQKVQSLIQSQKTAEKIIQKQQQSASSSKLRQDLKLKFQPVSPANSQIIPIVGLAVDAFKYQYKQQAKDIQLLEVFSADKSADVIVIKLLCQDSKNKSRFEFLFESQRKIAKKSTENSITIQYEEVPANLLLIPQFQSFITKFLVTSKAENHKLRNVQWCKQNNKKIRLNLFNEAQNRNYFIETQNSQIDQFFRQLQTKNTKVQSQVKQIQGQKNSLESQATLIEQSINKPTFIKEEKTLETKVQNHGGKNVQVKIEKTYVEEKLSSANSQQQVFAEAQTTIKSKIQPVSQVKKYDLSQYESIPNDIIMVPSFAEMILRVIRENIKQQSEVLGTYWKKNNNDQILIEIKTANQIKQYVEISISNVNGIFIESKKQKEQIKEAIQQNSSVSIQETLKFVKKFQENAKATSNDKGSSGLQESSSNTLVQAPKRQISATSDVSQIKLMQTPKFEVLSSSEVSQSTLTQAPKKQVFTSSVVSQTKLKQAPKIQILSSSEVSQSKLAQAARREDSSQQVSQSRLTQTSKAEALSSSVVSQSLPQPTKPIQPAKPKNSGHRTRPIQPIRSKAQKQYITKQANKRLQLNQKLVTETKQKNDSQKITVEAQTQELSASKTSTKASIKSSFSYQAISLEKLPFTRNDPQYLAFITSDLQSQFKKSQLFTNVLDFIAVNRKLPTTESFKVVLFNAIKFGVRVVLEQFKSAKLYQAIVQFHQNSGKYSYSLEYWNQIKSLHEISIDPFQKYRPLIERDSQLQELLMKSLGKGSAFENIRKLDSVEKKVAPNGIYFKCIFNSKDSKQFLTEILYNPEIKSAEVIEYHQVNMPYDFNIEQDYQLPYDRDFEQVEDYLINKFGDVFYGAKIVYVKKSPINNLPQGQNIDNFRIILTSNSGRYQVVVSYNYKTKNIKLYRFQQLDQGFKIPGFAGCKTVAKESTVNLARQYVKKFSSLIRPDLKEDIQKNRIELKQQIVEIKDIPDYGQFYKVIYREPIPVCFTFFESQAANNSSAYLSSIEELPIFPTNRYYSNALFKGYKQIRPSELKLHKAFLTLEEKARTDYSNILNKSSLVQAVFEREINRKNFYKIVYNNLGNILIGTCQYDPKNQIYQVLSVKKSDDLTVQGTYSENCDKLDVKKQECVLCKKGFIETAGRCYTQLKGCKVQIGYLCYFCDNGFVQGSDKLCYKNPEKVISQRSRVQIVKSLDKVDSEQNLISVTKSIPIEIKELKQNADQNLISTVKSIVTEVKELKKSAEDDQNLISVTKSIPIEVKQLKQNADQNLISVTKSIPIEVKQLKQNADQNLISTVKSIATEVKELKKSAEDQKGQISATSSTATEVKEIKANGDEQIKAISIEKPLIALASSNGQSVKISAQEQLSRSRKDSQKQELDKRSIPPIRIEPSIYLTSSQIQSRSNQKTSVEQISQSQKGSLRSIGSSKSIDSRSVSGSIQSSLQNDKILKTQYKQENSGKSVIQAVSTGIKHSAVSYNDPYCLSYDGPNCKFCTYRYFLKDGICTKISDSCSSYDRQSGECNSCYTGYYLTAGNCIQRDPLCSQTNSKGQCIGCYKSYVLLDGKCYYQNGQMLRKNFKKDSLCKQYDQKSGTCIKCVEGTYMNSNGQCKIADPNCAEFNEKYGICVSCIRGYEQIKGKCVRKTASNW